MCHRLWLKPVTRREASIRLARRLAHRILSEELDPVGHTRDFELLWIEADYPSEIQDAGSLDDEKYVAEHVGQTEAQFREYARGVLIELVNASTQSS